MPLGEPLCILKGNIMITFKHTGDFESTRKFFEKASKNDYVSRLHTYGEIGVKALASATPIDTGKTASSWDYKIKQTKNSISLIWTNSNIVDGVPVVILIQYGHGTRSGTYVQGFDFINPIMRPIFDEISEQIRREVTL